MAERAARHPAINSANGSGMRDAVKIFRKWLDDRDTTSTPSKYSSSKNVANSASTSASKSSPMKGKDAKEQKLHDEEREQRIYLTKTKANAHAKRNCKTEADFANYAKADRKTGVEVLKTNAWAVLNRWFDFDVTAFVAIFGGPGEHGYGSHVCLSAQAKGLPSFRCVDNFNGKHLITVLNKTITRPGGGTFTRDIEVLNLGKRFPLSEFTLEYDGESERARYLTTKSSSGSGLGSASKKRQSSLADYFGKGAAKRQKK